MEIKMPSETVRRGQRLAERQRAHLFELELTGRWRLYFKSEEEFKAKIAAASESIAQWARLVPDDPIEEPEGEAAKAQEPGSGELGSQELEPEELEPEELESEQPQSEEPEAAKGPTPSKES
jgi:hypothetical protein